MGFIHPRPEQLERWLDGDEDLSPAERLHVDTCRDCQSRVREGRIERALLRAHDPGSTPLPPTVGGDVLHQSVAEEPPVDMSGYLWSPDLLDGKAEFGRYDAGRAPLRRGLGGLADAPEEHPDSERLAAWLEHRLPRQEIRALDRHVGGCDPCLSAALALHEALDAADRSAVPDRAVKAVLAALDRRGRPSRGDSAADPWLVGVAASRPAEPAPAESYAAEPEGVAASGSEPSRKDPEPPSLRPATVVLRLLYEGPARSVHLAVYPGTPAAPPVAEASVPVDAGAAPAGQGSGVWSGAGPGGASDEEPAVGPGVVIRVGPCTFRASAVYRPGRGVVAFLHVSDAERATGAALKVAIADSRRAARRIRDLWAPGLPETLPDDIRLVWDADGKRVLEVSFSPEVAGPEAAPSR